MRFEWDENKNISNFKKHKVRFEMACEVFADQMAISIFDPDHSEEEDRYVLIGKSFSELVLVVVHTFRDGDDIEVVRIISARKTTRQEQKIYDGVQDERRV